MKKLIRTFLWQIAAGFTLFGLFMYLGAFRHLEPFYTYLYLFAWGPFLFILDRLLKWRTGLNSIGEESFSKTRHFLWLSFLSTTVWLIFETLNVRLHNWFYIGLPRELWIRWPGYAFSFATVIPGILYLHRFIESFFNHPNRFGDKPIVKGNISPSRPLIIGALMLLAALALPDIFYFLIWGAFIFLLDPYVAMCGGHSLLRDWKNREWITTKALLLSGLLCGLFWEACNFKAGAKWSYHIPFVGFLKVFEMPLAGFIGFPVFALEVFAFDQAASLGWKKLSAAKRRAVIALCLAFWCLAFFFIDRCTVIRWRE